MRDELTKESADAPTIRSGVSHCVFCGTPFTADNCSKDHVFPEGIGGWFTVDFVCHDCNSKFGGTFDADLGKNAFVHAAKAQLKWDGSPHLKRQNITGTSQTGDRVKIVVRKGSDARQIIVSRQPDGRLIASDEIFTREMASRLRGLGWSEDLIQERFIDKFEIAPNGVAIPVMGAGLDFMRHKDWPLTVTYEDMTAPFRWALVAKIAVEVYLDAGFAHDIPIPIIPMDFDELRAAVLANDPDRLSVWCPPYGKVGDVSSVPYQPFHSVTFGVSGGILSAIVCLFGVLRFAVCLGRVLHPDGGDWRSWEIIFPLRNTGPSREVEFVPPAADSVDRYEVMMGAASLIWCDRHGLL